jgi:hypothetical protein
MTRIALASLVALALSAPALALPEPDCWLTDHRTHASVVGSMHIPTATCNEFRTKFSPDPECAVPKGFRRTKPADVSGAVGAEATKWLHATPPDGLWLSKELDLKNTKGKVQHYRFRTEYHCHTKSEKGPQGWHKGVTVYVKAD